MSDDLLQLSGLTEALLRNLASGQRRTLLRNIAKKVQARQRERIARQQNPDGSAFVARRKRPEATRGAFAVRFLYPKGDATPREVVMKSWTVDGPLMTGFDQVAGAIRSFHRDRVAQWLPLEPGQQNASAGKVRRKGAIRRKAMFRKLASARHLKANATATEAWVGFSGQAARVGRIHQDGLADKPSESARPVRYSRRTLLGLTDADHLMVIEEVMAALVDATG